MREPGAWLLCLGVLASACGDGDSRRARFATFPSAAAPTPSPSSGSAAARAIDVGNVVSGTLSYSVSRAPYQLTSPSDGTLVAGLTWTQAEAYFGLQVDESLVEHQGTSSPVVARLRVVAGRKYLVTVVLFAVDTSPWDYDLPRATFTLTTSLDE